MELDFDHLTAAISEGVRRGTETKVVPAQPGFTMLIDIEGQRVCRLPVIAWAIDAGGKENATEPVSTGGMPDRDYSWVVMQPDGLLVGFGGSIWASIEEWQKACKRARENEREKIARRKAQR